MRGYPDGSFKPAMAITRAEALVVLNKAMMDRKEISEEKEEFTGIIEKAGVYGPETDTKEFDGDVYIKTDGATLQNILIKGDLIIAEEVGDGEVYLNNVTVEGDTYIRGGGVDSIYINDGRYNRIIIQKSRSGIRILAVGAGISALMIYPETAGNEVILQGDYEEVTIKTDGISLTTKEDTTIKKLIVYEETKNTQVTTSKETVIDLLDVNTTTNVTNEGRIIRALGTGAENSEYKVNLPENLQPRSSGGSGGSSGSSTASVSGITATPSPGEVAMGTSVTLSTATAGATIYYTLDSSTPTTSSNQYTSPITINAATTIKAIGVKSGMNNSPVATFSYTVDETTKPKMTVSPSQVTADSDFNETFTLTIANDTVVNTVYAKDVSLAGVFQGLNIGTVARTNSTTVTAAVYGNLANPGVGTIILDADALVNSNSSLEVDVIVAEDTAVPVSAITVTGEGDTTTITTDAGTLQMLATVTPTNASNKEVNWSVTSGTGLATIDSNGLLTAVANGTVIVVATAQDGSGVIGSHQITISGQSSIVVKSSSELWNALDNSNISTIIFGNDIEYQGLGGSTSTHALVNGQTIDGNGFTLTIGQLNINADNVKIKDLTVIGNVVIASGVNNFTAQGTNFDHLTIISGGFASGSGTFDDPWIIETAEQLNLIRDNLDRHFKLVDDIDLEAYLSVGGAEYNDGKGWEPIGETGSEFIGTFNGNGFTISNLTINRPEEDYVGLFGYVAEGTVIDKVYLEGVAVTGNRYVGGLVGYNNKGEITNSYVKGSVNGNNNRVGGLVGSNNTGYIKDSYATGAVNGNMSVGGLVGYNNKGTIENSYATGNVTGRASGVGGLVGENGSNSIIRYSYATGNVTKTGDSSATYYGGLVGSNHTSTIENSYATGSVTSDRNQVGGLVGMNWDGTIVNSYATGTVEGSTYVGGLVGRNENVVEHSYWNTETSGQTTSDGGDGKTISEMQQVITFINWDFNKIWDIDEGVTYPYLKNNTQDPKPTPPAG